MMPPVIPNGVSESQFPEPVSIYFTWNMTTHVINLEPWNKGITDIICLWLR